MSKYFAKYLPVEGEINIGDYFIDTGAMSNGTLVGKRANKEGVYDYQKVKLFLCSKDIQVGDKNVHADTLGGKSFRGYVATVGKNGCGSVLLPDTQQNDELVITDSMFKVIGEISPEATWVKEGDEFNDDEVCIIYLNPPIEGVVYANKIRQFMGIKGPCGHFH